MSTPFHNIVSLAGFNFEDSILTVNLAAGITAADVGKPVELDTSGANKFKIATDAKRIVGRLEVVEAAVAGRPLVGSVAFRFAHDFKVKAADALAVGDYVCGAGSGEVRKAVVADPQVDFLDQNIIVTQVTGGYATLVKI